jgi:hypothetical protein
MVDPTPKTTKIFQAAWMPIAASIPPSFAVIRDIENPKTNKPSKYEIAPKAIS